MVDGVSSAQSGCLGALLALVLYPWSPP